MNLKLVFAFAWSVLCVRKPFAGGGVFDRVPLCPS